MAHYNVTGYVYFIQAGDELVVKIGSTIDEPARRLAALQTSSHHRLRLVGTIDLRKEGVIAPNRVDYSRLAREREQAIHLEFASDRLQGEWFALTDRLRAFIDRTCTATNRGGAFTYRD